MLYVCLSFDHELFLGDNFIPEKDVLIDPTNRILEVLTKHNISGTFFSDVCSILRYSELGLKDYPFLMEEQLKDLTLSGQDVQLHIHPNWLKSHYHDGRWIIDSKSYRIQTFSNEDQSINNNWTMQSIIESGKEWLELLLKDAWADYACVAFRAGGFCIQPEKELLSCLIDNGILIDSSIAPGVCSTSLYNHYDFRNCPKGKMNWYISPSEGIFKSTIKEEKRIFEVPVATTKRSLFRWFTTREKYIDTKPHRGRFISSHEDHTENSQDIVTRFFSFKSTPVILSLDYFESRVVTDFIKQIFNDYKCKQNDIYISVICHPKLANDALITNLNQFIESINKLDNINICNMRNIYDIITT